MSGSVTAASGICSTGKRHTQAGRSCRYRRGALSSGESAGAKGVACAKSLGKDRPRVEFECDLEVTATSLLKDRVFRGHH